MTMPGGDDIGQIRHERLENVYRLLSDLMIHEDGRFTDIFNIMRELLMIQLSTKVSSLIYPDRHYA